MEQKIILFQSGSHGNFLEKYLNVSCGYNENFDFFENFFGAHSKPNKYTNNPFVCVHPAALQEKDQTIFCYIYVDKKDLYKLCWHGYFAAGEFGLNLLNNKKNFTSLFYEKLKSNENHIMLRDTISSILRFEKTDNGLREYFKKSFSQYNGILSTQEDIIKNYKIQNYFYFNDFYSDNFDQKIKDNLDIDIQVKTDNHRVFLERKKDIIKSEDKVNSAVDAFLKGQYYSLEDFCLYEQAYFDHLVEEHYNITLKMFYKQYPTNTLEYEIQEDK